YPIDLDFEIRFALQTARRHTDGPGHVSYDTFQFEGLLLQSLEVVAEDLHAELRADARAEHQDPVLDGLQEPGHIAGDLREFLGQLPNKLFFGHAWTPLGVGLDPQPFGYPLRFENNRCLDHLDGRGVRGRFSPAQLPGYRGDFGHLADD